MSRLTRWTPERDARLTKLWNQGLTVAVIANLFGQTRNSIIGRAHRMMLAARPSPIIRSPGGPKRIQRQGNIAPPAPRVTLAVVDPDEKPPVIITRIRAIDPNHRCQWPMTSRRPWLFCDAPRLAVNGVYCAEHCAVAYVKQRPTDAVAA